VVLGAGAGLAGVAWRTRTQGAAPLPGPSADQAHARIVQALGAEARGLEPAAAEAARVPELMAALKMGADRATAQDLLENEDWWARYRSRFQVTAVVADTTLAVLGPGATHLADSAVVRDARARGVASGILPGDGRAFVAAAAAATNSERPGKAPVILLGSVIDGAMLKKIAGLTGDAVGLADKTKLIEAAGAGEAMRALEPLVGRGEVPPTALTDGRLGAAWSIGDDLFLVAAFAAPEAPPPPVNPGLVLAGLGGALLVAGGLMVTLRRARPVAEAPGVTSAQVERAPTTAERERRVFREVGTDPAAGEERPKTPARFAPRMTEAKSRAEAQGGTMPLASVASLRAPSAPTHMGRYELIERIGEGGMAEIFFAAARGEKNFVRYFVVKRMHPHVARHRESVDQFTDEARLQATLVHSNIVPVFDFGMEQGEYYLALEYIHGRDVGQVLDRHMERFGRPLDIGTAFYVLHDVLEALAFAHSQTEKDGTPLEIIHRDVSPGNVLVSYRGEVKLTDFGIAKADKRVSHTEVGTVKGNAAFMSPEQARGEPVDQRSDIFSAGMVLYYCLSGQLLYRGETTVNRLLRAAVGPATSQFGHIDQLPGPAAKVLNRALAMDRDRRYQSAAEFAQELIPHMTGRPQMTVLMDALFPANLRRDLR
jgi:tRNA A-37 threonylcarbamoyl transferase component Bud32